MLKRNSILSAFATPDSHRKLLRSSDLIKGSFDEVSGKTFMCLHVTRFCPVNCKFCFFKSAPVYKKSTIQDRFSEEGFEKLLKFANSINLGYLLVSGGGEPMMERKQILRIIKEFKTERIALVTSGNWASSYKQALSYIQDIKKAVDERELIGSVTLRISVDKDHIDQLGYGAISNIISIFHSIVPPTDKFDLQIHSLVNDDTIDELCQKLATDYMIKRETTSEERISDGVSVMKIVPKSELITFDHLKIKVGYARTFYSDMRVDLNGNVEKNLDVFETDMMQSEDGNSSVVTNKLGAPGLDFWMNYNGNVTTWGNQILDNLFNIYEDSAEDIIDGTLSDPALLSFIYRGMEFRDKIISEVNPTTVARSKSVNIRDYAGALMFDEARTRLYYTIRVLQIFRQEGKIKEEAIKKLPDTLKFLLEEEPSMLRQAYLDAEHTIVEQILEKSFEKSMVLDYLELIKLGHYQLNNEKVEKLINYYNENVSVSEKIIHMEDATPPRKLQIARLTDYITFIKPSVKENFIGVHS